MRILGERPIESRPIVRRQWQALAQPFHQVGVADKVPPKQQPIIRPALQDAPAIRVIEPTSRQERRVGPDGAERSEVHGGQAPRVQKLLLLGLGEDLLVTRLNEADVAEAWEARLELARQVAPGLEALLAAGLVEEAERAEPDREVLLAADGGRQRVHKLEHEAAPLLGGSAVVVGALVDVAAQELLGEVPVAAMHLDAVEAALLHGKGGGLDEICNGLLDFGHRHSDGRVRGEFDALRGVRRRVRKDLVGIVPGGGRGGEDRGAGQVRDVGAPRVPELRVDIATFGVDGRDDFLPAGDLLWEEEAWNARHGVALFFCVSDRASSFFYYFIFMRNKCPFHLPRDWAGLPPR